MLSGMPPGKQRIAWSKKFPSPPFAWSARLSSSTFRYSGVSGASCPNPQGFVWSNEGCPPRPGTTNRAHAPFQSGYFASSAALTLPPGITKVASAMTATKLRRYIVTSLTKCAWLAATSSPSHLVTSKNRHLSARRVPGRCGGGNQSDRTRRGPQFRAPENLEKALRKDFVFLPPQDYITCQWRGRSCPAARGHPGPFA